MNDLQYPISLFLFFSFLFLTIAIFKPFFCKVDGVECFQWLNCVDGSMFILFIYIYRFENDVYIKTIGLSMCIFLSVIENDCNSLRKKISLVHFSVYVLGSLFLPFFLSHRSWPLSIIDYLLWDAIALLDTSMTAWSSSTRRKLGKRIDGEQAVHVPFRSPTHIWTCQSWMYIPNLFMQMCGRKKCFFFCFPLVDNGTSLPLTFHLYPNGSYPIWLCVCLINIDIISNDWIRSLCIQCAFTMCHSATVIC